MKIQSVKINNILSIEDAFVEFDDNGLMLVQGWNHDVGRANGAGKTAIFNALTFALFDKLPRKITATEILRRGCKAGYVEVSLSCGGHELTVRRSRPKGVMFSKDGVKQTITQEEWEHSIGLNYNQFIISMYCAQGTSQRFLSINDGDKKQFLLQLLNLQEFSSCKVVADKKVKQLEDEEKANQSKVDSIDAKLDAYSESLIDEIKINQYLDIANQNIVELQTVLVEQKLTTKPDLSKFQVLEDNINVKRTEFTRARTKRELLHDQYRRAESKVKPFDSERYTCLSCGSALDNASGEAERNHEQACEVAKNELASLKIQIDACDEALSKESQINDLAIKLRDKKREESREYEIASSRVIDAQSKLLLKQREVKEYILKLQNNSELQNKIKTLTGSKVEALNKKANFLKEIDLYKTVSAMYSPTGAQAYILDSVVESFNERVVAYVSLLWPNLTYELQSYKENVDGGLSAKFSEVLVMDGKPISIGSLSGGEFRALSLCVDFALVDVMERQFGISMSPIILDEPFDGLDSTGRELIVSLLEEIADARQVVVIDHTSEIKSMFSKVLSVEKQNGVSTVKLET